MPRRSRPAGLVSNSFRADIGSVVPNSPENDDELPDDFPPLAPPVPRGPAAGQRGPGTPGVVMENQEFLQSPPARPLRILGEYLHPATVFRDERVTDTITFFGSARIKPPAELLKPGDASERQPASGPDEGGAESGASGVSPEFAKYYVESMEMARAITAWSLQNAEPQGRRVLVMTGGGPGIMEAANRGAQLAGGQSAGLSIQLPFEEDPNPYISPHLNFNFQYFFMRKYWFLYYARALMVFPGGFGTLDELFETLTLQQTRHINNVIPVFLFGKSFWERLIDFKFLAQCGMISERDLELFHIVDSVPEAMSHLEPILRTAVLEA